MSNYAPQREWWSKFEIKFFMVQGLKDTYLFLYFFFKWNSICIITLKSLFLAWKQNDKRKICTRISLAAKDSCTMMGLGKYTVANIYICVYVNENILELPCVYTRLLNIIAECSTSVRVKTSFRTDTIYWQLSVYSLYK